MASEGETVENDERLPWLETADDDYEDRPSLARLVPLVLLGLGLIAALVFGAYWLQQAGGKPKDSEGKLIAAQEGDYKVKPDKPGGMKVEGEGDTAYATSEGKGPTAGKIDTRQIPETPVTARKDAPAPAAGGALVQLGAFPDVASANAAWARASKRFAYLAPLAHSVMAASVNGHNVQRLRVNAGSVGAAQELCGKLKAAGEACFVTN